jgi:pimeloyl-ACP methyl ester carboxylesterase
VRHGAVAHPVDERALDLDDRDLLDARVGEHALEGEAQAEPADDDVPGVRHQVERQRGQLDLRGRLEGVHDEHAVGAQLQHVGAPVGHRASPQHQLAALALGPGDLLHRHGTILSDADYGGGMRWSAADGRVLQGWLGGADDGPLVAVLHGCPDTRHVAMTGDAAARAAGVRLLCVNRPGYGDSTPYDSSHASVADDLVGVAATLGHGRLGVLAMSVGGGYAVACAARHPDRVAVLGLVATQPPGERSAPVADLEAEVAPEFLAWRASVAPEDPDDEALAARWVAMLPPADGALVAALGSRAVAASVREALARPEGYLRDAALSLRPWPHRPEEVRCPVRAWFGEEDDRSAAAPAATLTDGFGDVEVVVRPATSHLATLVAHWPAVLATLRSGWSGG